MWRPSAARKQGAAGLTACCDKIFRALSEYCLQTDATLTGTITLTAREDGLDFALNDAGPQKLFDLLPAAYTGAVEEIRKELNDLVGLAPVKEYVFGLADNIQVQQRRAAAGLKTASLSMHMIFTGNPGTGKTTIARLVAKYLKAIGALKGGQLVEVSRGDLVGRYTGHTAPDQQRHPRARWAASSSSTRPTASTGASRTASALRPSTRW